MNYQINRRTSNQASLQKKSSNNNSGEGFFSTDDNILISKNQDQEQSIQKKQDDANQASSDMTFNNDKFKNQASENQTPQKNQGKTKNEVMFSGQQTSELKKSSTIITEVIDDISQGKDQSQVVRQLTYQDTASPQTQKSANKKKELPLKRNQSEKHGYDSSPGAVDLKRNITPMTREKKQREMKQRQMFSSTLQVQRDQSPFAHKQSVLTVNNGSVTNWADQSKSLLKSSSAGYFSVRKNSPAKKSIVSQLHPKEQKVGIDYFLGTAKKLQVDQKAQLKDQLTNVMQMIQAANNGQEIINNLKVIFFEHSQFVEGGTMGSSVQPINQNMMTLYLFHTFLKRYQLVHDHRQSHSYEMMFVEISNKQMKRIDFNQFGTALAKIAIRLYVDDSTARNVESIDTLELTLRLINERLFSLAKLEVIEEQKQENQESAAKNQSQRNSSPSSKVEQVDNEFDRYKQEYESSDAKKVMLREKKNLEKIFNSYSKGSKRGVKILALRQFKWLLRDLSIIPHITTEYKCAQLFKFLDSSKNTTKDYPEEILTLEVFPMSIYIIFSLILEDETEIKQKALFIIKWLKEHSKDKLAGVHGTKEDRRLKFTNLRLATAAGGKRM